MPAPGRRFQVRLQTGGEALPTRTEQHIACARQMRVRNASQVFAATPGDADVRLASLGMTCLQRPHARLTSAPKQGAGHIITLPSPIYARSVGPGARTLARLGFGGGSYRRICATKRTHMMALLPVSGARPASSASPATERRAREQRLAGQ